MSLVITHFVSLPKIKTTELTKNTVKLEGNAIDTQVENLPLALSNKDIQKLQQADFL